MAWLLAQIVFVGVILLTKSGAQQAKHVEEEEAKAEAGEGEVEMSDNPVFDDAADKPAPADKPVVPAVAEFNKSFKPETDPDIPLKGKSQLLNMDTYRFTSE